MLKQKVSGILVIFGGLLITISGYTKSSLVNEIIYYINTRSINNESFNVIEHIVLSMLSFFIGMGGITVMIGGLSILKGFRIMGKVLVGLGGSVGTFGLIVTLGYSIYFYGITAVITYAAYWIGLILALIGSKLAK